jgi:phosphoribosylamine--glycine ligase
VYFCCEKILSGMNILILGSGGREHALAWKIAQSALCSTLYIAPGNAGTTQCGININLDIFNFEQVVDFCSTHDISLVVVGPETPLVEGITDAFRRLDPDRTIHIVGPDAHAAQLEGSKAFAKKFMQKYGIPTAAYLEVNQENIADGIQFLKSQSPPYVLKADGLAAGKGVLILDNQEEAVLELKAMLGGKFGKASGTVVIEEFLSGIEFSVFGLTDGKDYTILPEAKDYKRVGEGDTGLNTGGMGAVSPVPFVDHAMWQKVISRIIRPTIDGIASENMDYKGFVFFGLINVSGDPYVIEYNCRLGDPETEVIIPRIESDIVPLLVQAARGNLASMDLKISDLCAVTVMLVSGGYPGEFVKHKKIDGCHTVNESLVFHAGTVEKDGEILTNGGRVMAVTSLDEDMQAAISRSLKCADDIRFEGKYYRRDIGFDLK